MRTFTIAFVAAVFLSGASCGQRSAAEANTPLMTKQVDNQAPAGTQLATFGQGCFWCAEAIFQQLNGVTRVVSGYSGGNVESPSYEQVCTGTTGHAEVVQVTYDPSVITYDELLEVFWSTHDPTTLNRQGHDIGTQYRSVIFYHNEEQKRLAEGYLKRLDESGAFNDPIVTQIEPYGAFYEAEDYHKNYYRLNSNAPYCSFVIKPKLDKFKKAFADKLSSK